MAASKLRTDPGSPLTSRDDIEGLLFVVKSYQHNCISPFRSLLIRMVAGVGKKRLIVVLLLIALALIVLALAIASSQPAAAIALAILAGGCLFLALFLT